MGSNFEACDECAQNCLMIHRKHDPSSIVSSFFKVMYDKLFSEVLIVPPRFARLTSLVCQKTYLEDSNGRKWDAVLSNVNGSLAVKEGWREFSEDHGIEFGDFVVFHYIIGSHFVVQIYGRNGCEKLSFSAGKRNTNKRAKTSEDFSVRTGTSDSFCEKTRLREGVETNVFRPGIDVTQRKDDPNPSKGNGIKGSKVAPSANIMEDSYFIVNRDLSYVGEDDRAHLFDLSTFEMLNNKVDEVQFQVSRCLQKCADNCHIAEENTATRSKYGKGLVSGKEDTPVPRSCLSVNMPLCSKLTQISNAIRIKSEFSTATGERTGIFNQDAEKFCRNLALETSHDTDLGTFTDNVINTGELGEDFDHLGQVKARGDAIVKPEPSEFCDLASEPVIKITCSVKPDSEFFLELPEQLPMKVYRQGEKLGHWPVYLRDPARRLWPVIYHQRNGFTVLTSGWTPFRKANDIQPGATCTFVVESDGVFEVQICHG